MMGKSEFKKKKKEQIWMMTLTHKSISQLGEIRGCVSVREPNSHWGFHKQQIGLCTKPTHISIYFTGSNFYLLSYIF